MIITMITRMGEFCWCDMGLRHNTDIHRRYQDGQDDGGGDDGGGGD
jgi:hypothetical protein